MTIEIGQNLATVILILAWLAFFGLLAKLK